MKCSISEIFETRGEDFFRNLEQEVILHRSKPENMIIATGGGVFENPRLLLQFPVDAYVFYGSSFSRGIMKVLQEDGIPDTGV